jgi:hypothetical protein
LRHLGGHRRALIILLIGPQQDRSVSEIAMDSKVFRSGRVRIDEQDI